VVDGQQGRQDAGGRDRGLCRHGRFAEMSASDPPPDSILRLFQPDSIESSLTDWDIAFLKSL
jgi:hypothetical protein